MFNIALYQPDIPQNTAAIIRLCSCFNTTLEIIEPCGFHLNDKRLKKVAMDYLDKTKIITYRSYKEFLNALMDNDNNELIPIKNAAIRIGNYTSISESVKRLDYLVDYYQSGLSMEIEGILRGYGYLQNFSTDSVLVLYDKLVKQE